MNTKSRAKVLHDEARIEVNTTFAKMMENPLSEEYKLLQELRRDYPMYSVSRRQIKKNPNQEHYSGLSYEYMEWYIKKYGPKDENKLKALLSEFEHQKDIASCHSRSKRYPVVKNWFFDKFPEVKTFGMSAEQLEAFQKAQEEKEQANAERVIPFSKVEEEKKAS